jgi:hypothetical protein
MPLAMCVTQRFPPRFGKILVEEIRSISPKNLPAFPSNPAMKTLTQADDLAASGWLARALVDIIFNLKVALGPCCFFKVNGTIAGKEKHIQRTCETVSSFYLPHKQTLANRRLESTEILKRFFCVMCCHSETVMCRKLALKITDGIRKFLRLHKRETRIVSLSDFAKRPLYTFFSPKLTSYALPLPEVNGTVVLFKLPTQPRQHGRGGPCEQRALQADIAAGSGDKAPATQLGRRLISPSSHVVAAPGDLRARLLGNIMVP